MPTIITPRRSRGGIAPGELRVLTADDKPGRSTRPNKPTGTISKDELLALVSKDILDLAAVSELTGVRERSLSIYHNRGSMPAPDLRKGQAPLWHRETIEQWNATRSTRTQNVAKAK